MSILICGVDQASCLYTLWLQQGIRPQEDFLTSPNLIWVLTRIQTHTEEKTWDPFGKSSWVHERWSFVNVSRCGRACVSKCRSQMSVRSIRPWAFWVLWGSMPSLPRTPQVDRADWPGSTRALVFSPPPHWHHRHFPPCPAFLTWVCDFFLMCSESSRLYNVRPQTSKTLPRRLWSKRIQAIVRAWACPPPTQLYTSNTLNSPSFKAGI